MLLQKLKNSGVWMTIKIHYIKYIYAHPPRTVGHKSAVHYPNKVERGTNTKTTEQCTLMDEGLTHPVKHK